MRSRKLLAAASCLSVLGMFVAGCAPAAAPAATPATTAAPKQADTPSAKPAVAPTAPGATPKPAAEEPKYGGSVTRLRENYPDMLDPHLCRGAAWWNDVLGPAYSGLLMLDEKMEIVPDLVEKWEQPSDREYVLRLRQGAKFHDTSTMKGREFTAEDVRYSISRMGSNDPRLLRKWQFQGVSTIETPDKYTVKLILKEPTAPFLNFMAQPYNYMVGKEAVEKFGDLSREEAGTGPFYLKSWTEKISYKLARNPGYFVKGMPYLDEVNVIVVPDSATRLAAFRSGRADYVLVSHTDLNSLKAANPKVTAASLPTTQVFFVFHPDKKPFNDQRVRQAFSLAIDRQALIDIVMEGEAELCGPIYGVADSWKLSQDELKRLYKPDIAQAKKLMTEAGYPNGFPLDVKVSSQRKDSMDTLTVVTGQMKQIGVEIKQQVLEHTTLIAQRTANDYIAMLHAGSAAIEPGERLPNYWGPGGQWNLKDPDLNRLMEEQLRAVDVRKRLEIFNQFERTFIEKAYGSILFGYGEQLAMQPKVKGPRQPSAFSQHLVAFNWLEK